MQRWLQVVRTLAIRMGCKSPRSLQKLEGAIGASGHRLWLGPLGLVFFNIHS